MRYYVTVDDGISPQETKSFPSKHEATTHAQTVVLNNHRASANIMYGNSAATAKLIMRYWYDGQTQYLEY